MSKKTKSSFVDRSRSKRKGPRSHLASVPPCDRARYRKDPRRAVANYMYSEGCGCCGDREAHQEHRAILARLLGVPPHPEQRDYYDFSKYRSKGTTAG